MRRYFNALKNLNTSSKNVTKNKYYKSKADQRKFSACFIQKRVAFLLERVFKLLEELKYLRSLILKRIVKKYQDKHFFSTPQLIFLG
jgi:hypothetical protein